MKIPLIPSFILFLIVIHLPFSFLIGEEINLPPNLGQNNIGTEFFLTFHPAYEVENPSNMTLLYISSDVVTQVRIEVPARNYFDTIITKADNVVEVRLDIDTTLPYRKAGDIIPLPDSVFRKQAIHITSDDPITVYGLAMFEYSSDGYLALPVSGLGKRYIVSSYNDPSDQNTGKNQFFPSYSSIVAAFDSTIVKFTLGGNDSTISAGGMVPGETKTVNLDKGDIFLVGSSSKGGDLTGSIVEADKPVGVISGNYCAEIPVGFNWCKYTIEMELPDCTWGKEFHIPILENDDKKSKKSTILRIMPSEDNTIIYRDGMELASIPESGGIINQGFIEVRRDSDPISENVYTASSPISITAYNPSEEYDSPTKTPFQMILTPVQQYQYEIVLFPAGSMSDYSFSDYYVAIVSEADTEGKIPASLMIWKKDKGDTKWIAMRDIVPETNIRHFSHDINQKEYLTFYYHINLSNVYKLKSNSTFAAYIYANSARNSYGCPASVALTDFNSPIDSLVPTVSWEIANNGEIIGKVDDDPNKDNNSSTLSMVSFLTSKSFNFIKQPDNIIPGTTVVSGWKLIRSDSTKPARATLFVSDRRGNDTTIIINIFGTSVTESMRSFNTELSPNPVDSWLFVDIDPSEDGIFSICLTDNLGVMVRNLSDKLLFSGRQSIPFDISDVPSGVYFLKISNSKNVEFLKIIKY
jgi:hypothetical protein